MPEIIKILTIALLIVSGVMLGDKLVNIFKLDKMVKDKNG